MKENKNSHSFEVLAFPLIIYIKEKQNEQKWKNNIKKKDSGKQKGQSKYEGTVKKKWFLLPGKREGAFLEG